jgi:DNA-binding NarL/FixJ family response regulator
MIKVALVDDHVLLRNGLASVISSFNEYEVIFEADNGKHFIECLKKFPAPELILLDINMPEMDGVETAKWIQKNQPEIKVLVLTMMDSDAIIIRMLKAGVKGYILKDSKPPVLKAALDDLVNKGFYMNEIVAGKLAHLMNVPNTGKKQSFVELTERETEFLKQCCTEKSYKEIADAMKILPRSVEKLRSDMFEKIGTTSRVGLVLYTIKAGLVTI